MGIGLGYSLPDDRKLCRLRIAVSSYQIFDSALVLGEGCFKHLKELISYSVVLLHQVLLLLLQVVLREMSEAFLLLSQLRANLLQESQAFRLGFGEVGVNAVVGLCNYSLDIRRAEWLVVHLFKFLDVGIGSAQQPLPVAGLVVGGSWSSLVLVALVFGEVEVEI